jgi:hypothetical protein
MPAEDAPTEAIDLGYDEPCPIGGPPVVRTFASPPVPLAQPVEGSSEVAVAVPQHEPPVIRRRRDGRSSESSAIASVSSNSS